MGQPPKKKERFCLTSLWLLPLSSCVILCFILFSTSISSFFPSSPSQNQLTSTIPIHNHLNKGEQYNSRSVSEKVIVVNKPFYIERKKEYLNSSVEVRWFKYSNQENSSLVDKVKDVNLNGAYVWLINAQFNLRTTTATMLRVR